MNTGDIFLCKQCALPIRNAWAATPTNNEYFLCPSCDVCDASAVNDISGVRNELLKLLTRVLRRLFHFQNGRRHLPAKVESIVKENLENQTNPAEARIERIKENFQKAKSPNDWLKLVAESEKTLAGFFYFAGPRRAMVNSQTILRHWDAIIKTMAQRMKEGSRTGVVAQELSKPTRYNLNLVRLSKLIGDNPIRIIRDPEHYVSRPGSHRGETRVKHLQKHLYELSEQTRNMNPKIADLQSLLRFAGNACFITDPDEVIEFRNKFNGYLIKYLIKDRILIVVDDFWFIRSIAAPFPKEIPPAELVTIYPEDLAKDQVINDLVNGRYVPNCVDLEELAQFLTAT